MQKTTYICDQCKKEIGDKKHISLTTLGSFSGVAIPPKGKIKNWIVMNDPKHRFLHFCSGKCAGEFFSNLMGE
jgi:ribosomal protein L24E